MNKPKIIVMTIEIMVVTFGAVMAVLIHSAFKAAEEIPSNCHGLIWGFPLYVLVSSIVLAWIIEVQFKP
jgi:predicted benzoate:H+ symporter BenE